MDQEGQHDDVDVGVDSKVKWKKSNIDIVRGYSEFSTVAGFVYIFMRDQTTFGKIFWTTVVILMLTLGAYWTTSIYINWQDHPVVTTATTTALPVTSIEFPSVTICGQGLNSQVFIAAFMRLYFEFQKKAKNETFRLSPIRSANIYSKFFLLVILN